MEGHGTGDRAALTTAVLLTAAVMALEVAGGYVSGSLALLSDAGHMLRDVLALLLSLGAVIVAERLPTKTRTFGYHRVEVLAAFVNGLLLIVLAGAILWEAVQRLSAPVAVGGAVMGAVGAVGLAANIAVAYILHGRDDLNVRSAFLHVLGDTLSSAAVIVAAVWIALTGQTAVDPLLSGAIAVVILASSYPLLRETVSILLQYTPAGMDFDEVVRAIEGVEGVESVHNVHLWSLCSHINILDAHVVTCVSDCAGIEAIKREIRRRLLAFDVKYSTLEFEAEPCPGCGKVCRIEAD
jgi:cobalt-zinc-cadmium efflux system protein